MKYSNSELLELIEADGIGYAIENISTKQLKDSFLADYWEELMLCIDRIKDYLEESSVEPYESENDNEDDSYD